MRERAKAFCLLALAASLLAIAPVAFSAPSSAPQRTAPVPQPRSPLDAFRELLAMSPSERAHALTNRPAEMRKQLQAKLREYDALGANERELRLRTTELRYYLAPLLMLSPAERSPRLENIPGDLLPLVRDRLTAWDPLPEDLKRDLIENESIIRYFRENEDEGSSGTNTMASGPPMPRLASAAHIEAGIARWRAIPPAQQQKVIERFDRLFTMSSAERANVLSAVSEPERRQIEAALQSFQGLPPAQRARCVQALNKYVSLTPEERVQFLRSAEKWKMMPPDQRQAWRDMVRRVAALPPMPPGANPWPLPPMPPAIEPAPHANGN